MKEERRIPLAVAAVIVILLALWAPMLFMAVGGLSALGWVWKKIKGKPVLTCKKHKNGCKF